MLGFGIQITPPSLSFCFVLSKIEIGKWMEGKACCDNLSNIFGAKPCKTNSYHSIIGCPSNTNTSSYILPVLIAHRFTYNSVYALLPSVPSVPSLVQHKQKHQHHSTSASHKHDIISSSARSNECDQSLLGPSHDVPFVGVRRLSHHHQSNSLLCPRRRKGKAIPS